MIAQSWFDRCWHWQIGGCVAIFGTLLVGGGDRVYAQIVPDNTLGAESSVVTPDVNIRGIQGDRIDGGAIRGANLFHSFEQLSVLEGRGAYFTNPAGILNIRPLAKKIYVIVRGFKFNPLKLTHNYKLLTTNYNADRNGGDDSDNDSTIF